MAFPVISNEHQLTYTLNIDLLEAIFSQAAAGDFEATAGGYASLKSVRETIDRLLTVANDKGQADRVGKLTRFQAQVQSILPSIGQTPEEKVYLFRGTALKQQQEKLSSSLTHSASSTASALDSPAPSSSSSLDIDSQLSEILFTCPICFDETPLSQTASLISCPSHHRVCLNCFRQGYNAMILDNERDLSCFIQGCSAHVLPEDLQNQIVPEIYDRYLATRVIVLLDKEHKYQYCPNPKCAQLILVDDACIQQATQSPGPSTTSSSSSAPPPVLNFPKCPACLERFCVLCQRPEHVESSCDGAALPEPERLFRLWLAEQSSKVKPCPSCKALTQKNEGCNHMTCVHCRAQWCWLCSMAYTSSHFSEGTCQDLQFSNMHSIEQVEELRRRRRVWDALSPEEQRQIALKELNDALARRRRIIEQEAPPPPFNPFA